MKKLLLIALLPSCIITTYSVKGMDNINPNVFLSATIMGTALAANSLFNGVKNYRKEAFFFNQIETEVYESYYDTDFYKDFEKLNNESGKDLIRRIDREQGYKEYTKKINEVGFQKLENESDEDFVLRINSTKSLKVFTTLVNFLIYNSNENDDSDNIFHTACNLKKYVSKQFARQELSKSIERSFMLGIGSLICFYFYNQCKTNQEA